jgi:hypothetical protein
MIFDRVRAHYEGLWGEPSREAEFTFDEASYEVYEWDAETHPGEANVYATNGASSHVLASKRHRVEIFIALRPAADDAALTAAMAASHPHRMKTELGEGHTILFEEPVWPGTTMRSLLFTRPLHPLIPHLELGDGAHVEFLQALPLFDSELAVKKTEGAESLLARWRAAGVRFWDPARAACP